MHPIRIPSVGKGCGEGGGRNCSSGFSFLQQLSLNRNYRPQGSNCQENNINICWFYFHFLAAPEEILEAPQRICLPKIVTWAQLKTEQQLERSVTVLPRDHYGILALPFIL